VLEKVSDTYLGYLSQETGRCKMTFKGHTDYLHSVAIREANRQVINYATFASFNVDFAYILYHMPTRCFMFLSGGNRIRGWDSPYLG
jgi:hypothetical protein